jgi:TonB family protein
LGGISNNFIMSTTLPPGKDAKARPGRRRAARFWAGSLLMLAVVTPLAAQSRLYVLEPDKAYYPVFKVSNNRPFIMKKGVLVAAKGDRFALRKVDEYLPVFIAIQNAKATTTDIQPIEVNAAIAMPDGVSGGGVFDGAGDAHRSGPVHRPNQGDPHAQIESVFRYSANFVAEYPLEDVFLVLEAEFANTGKSIVVCEIGQLEERKPKPISYELSRKQSFGSVKVTSRVFVGGTEVLQSEQSEAFRTGQLDRMIAKKIEGVKDAQPQPFYGSTPGYPAALRPSGLKGEVVVTVHVSPSGAVHDPVIESANNPAFGEAALAAVREWRFLPRVQNGRAVESQVSIPIDFEPPAKE